MVTGQVNKKTGAEEYLIEKNVVKTKNTTKQLDTHVTTETYRTPQNKKKWVGLTLWAFGYAFLTNQPLKYFGFK